MATTTRRPRLVLPVSERDHVQGPDDAPLTLVVEYGDYECPYCRLVYDDIQGLLEQLGDRLRYVYRHLPIESAHPHARLAAEAAEAAGAQGKFWEMHDGLYTHDDLNQARIYDFAEAIGLDVARFGQELDSGVYAERVREDFHSGIGSGANGTPTFFVNGERYDGPRDLESLLEVVERPLGVRARMLTEEFTRLAASGADCHGESGHPRCLDSGRPVGHAPAVPGQPQPRRRNRGSWRHRRAGGGWRVRRRNATGSLRFSIQTPVLAVHLRPPETSLVTRHLQSYRQGFG